MTLLLLKLLLKLLLAPALVVGSSLAARRWGAHVAGTPQCSGEVKYGGGQDSGVELSIFWLVVRLIA